MHMYSSNDLITYFGDQTCSIPIDQIDALRESAVIDRALRALLPAAFAESSLFFTRQVHGTQGLAVTPQIVEIVPLFTHDADFMITNHRGIALGVLTADCLPLVLHDRRNHAMAMVHAGWRGSVGGVLERAIHTMVDAYGTDPGTIDLSVGPAARGCCYEIGADVLEIIRAFSWADKVIEQRNGRWYADMVMLNVSWAQALGITSIVIEKADCTICNAHYCSYRRQGTLANRQISVALLM